MSRVQIVSLAGLLGVAAVIGLWLGLRSIPPGETALINAAAAEYVAETDGDLADCFARPSALERVRLVVICEPESGASWARALDRLGRVVPVDPAALAAEPVT